MDSSVIIQQYPEESLYTENLITALETDEEELTNNSLSYHLSHENFFTNFFVSRRWKDYEAALWRHVSLPMMTRRMFLY